MKLLVAVLLAFISSGCNGQSTSNTSGVPLLFSEEFTGSDCTVPGMIPYEDMKEISHLPNPFVFMNGPEISGINDWACRRAEIAKQIQHYELGEKPGAPESVSGSFDGDILDILIEDRNQSISFKAQIILPENGNPPYPAIIGIGRSFLDNDQLDSLGVAVINIPNDEIAEQIDSGSRGNGKFYDLYGSDHSAGALVAWAWGVSRVIDVLELIDSPINPDKLGVTGCSRNGKGALVAGAYDERITLTIPQESGAGGAAAWRISDKLLEDGQNVQTLRQIVDENVWFRESFSKFSESVEKLPYDHHNLMGMVAPRALLVLEHSGIEWLGPESTYGASQAARQIWEAMNVPERMGFSQVSGHNHCQLPDTQKPHVMAFIEAFLLHNTDRDTQIEETDRDFTVNKNQWIPWITPELK